MLFVIDALYAFHPRLATKWRRTSTVLAVADDRYAIPLMSTALAATGTLFSRNFDDSALLCIPEGLGAPDWLDECVNLQDFVFAVLISVVVFQVLALFKYLFGASPIPQPLETSDDHDQETSFLQGGRHRRQKPSWFMGLKS